jgi:hypothetical protein
MDAFGMDIIAKSVIANQSPTSNIGYQKFCVTLYAMKKTQRLYIELAGKYSSYGNAK